MDELDDLLRDSAPAVEISDNDADFAHVALAVARRRRRFTPRLWSRRTLTAAAAGLVLVPAAAAAGVLHFTAQTGIFGQPGKTENNTSQYIDMCAGDISQYVATLTPSDVVLPPGSAWSQIITEYVDGFKTQCPPRGSGVRTQATGIKTSLLLSAQCPWEKWALSAPADEQSVDLRRADHALASIESDAAALQAAGGFRGASSAEWKTLEHQYATASRQFLDYNYQVGCLGRNTSQNPPTVKDPDQ